MIIVSLMPNGFRLRLNATLSTENGYRAVKYTKGTLNFNSKVNVTWGVDDVNTVFWVLVTRTRPVTGSCSRSDSNTTLLLLLHPVHSSGTVMGITDFIVYTCIIQDTLGSSSFTSIDVCHDADISGIFQRIFSRHNCSPFRNSIGLLITIVSECLVSLCHLVSVLTLLNRATQIVSCVQNFASQTSTHGLLRTSTGVLSNPT